MLIADLTREELQQKLTQLFSPGQTRELVGIFDSFRRSQLELNEEQNSLSRNIQDWLAAQARSKAEVDQRFLELAQAQAESAQAQARSKAEVDQRFLELAQAQARTEKRMDELAQAQARTEKRVEELTQAQARTEKRLEELAQAQDRTEKRVEELVEIGLRNEARLSRLEELVDKLATSQMALEKFQMALEKRMDEMSQILKGILVSLDDLRGGYLELKYERHAGAFFGRFLRRLKPTLMYDLSREMEERLENSLSSEVYNDLLRLDLLISGRPRSRPDIEQLWLAVEISAVVDRHDVQRAKNRADALRRAGYLVVPAGVGDRFTRGAEEEASELNVLLMKDGSYRYWEEALSDALTI